MGSLRDLKRGSKKSEAASDTVKLYSKLQELVIEYGNAWTKIAEAIEAEGYRERGEILTSNALRMRYKRWKKSESAERLPVSSASPGSAEPAPLHSPVQGLEELISINNQLLRQIQESLGLMARLEKRMEEQELKTSHTEYTDEQPVSSRDLLELLKEMGAGRQQMRIIEEKRKDYVSREEVQQLIEETVQDRIDAELKTMLSEEGGVSKDIVRLIDKRLKTLFSRGESVAKTARAGPGRGRKGKTHKKFSASLEESLFDRVKSLPGQFSGHLSNALEAYLAVMEEKPED
jgi:hypothetical protein